MAKNKKKTKTRSYDKLKPLKELSRCMVVLHDIALDRDLVQLYQLHLPVKKTKQVEHSSSYTSISKNSSNNIWMLKENTLHKENNTEDGTSHITTSLKRLAKEKSKKECKNIEFQLNNKSIGTNSDISLDNGYRKIIQSEFMAQKQQLKHDTIVQSFSSKNNYETSSSSSYTYCGQETTMSIKNKKHSNVKRPSISKKSKSTYKRRLSFNKPGINMESATSNENYLDEENLTVADYNRKLQEESIKRYLNTNNNLYTAGITNGFCKVKLEQCQNSKVTDSSTQTTNVTESVTLDLRSMFPTMAKTNHTKTLPDLFKASIKNQHANNKTKRTRQSLPKITGDHILPKGTIKIMKINTSDESLQSNISEQVPPEQNRYNSTDRSMKQVSHIDDTFESTDIPREKKYHTSEINESINTLKISRSILARNNNIHLKDKNIDNNKFDSGKINRKILNSLIEIGNNVSNNVSINNTDDERTEIYESWFLKRQERSDRLDNDEMHESNVLQNGKKEEAIKQNRKRIAEGDATDIKQASKKKKLNRTSWLQNNATYAKSINHEQFNDFPSTNAIVTVESSMSEENNLEEKIQRDLRDHLNKKKTKQSLKLPTSESKFNNRDSAESEQLNLNNKNNITTTTNTTENKGYRKRLSFEEETTFNKTLYEETDNRVDLLCNNRLRRFSTPQSTSEETQHINEIDRSFHENTNIQDNNTSSMTEDDCISLFAESFDTNMCENTFSNEKNKSCKSVHSDVPYVMTASSFDKYMKQNATEFNDEYEKCVETNEVVSNETTETKTESNNQPKQKIHIDCIPATATASKLIRLPEARNVEISKYPRLKKINIKTFVIGYCFARLKRGTCYTQPPCRYKHDLQSLINAACSENPKAIIDVIQDALRLGYNFFCGAIYVTSLHKLTVDQILITYQMLHIHNLIDDFTISEKRDITHSIINELVGRQMSLKTIVDCLVQYIVPTKNLNHLVNILTCAERYIKSGEYWNTVRNLILRLPPDRHVIHKILFDCIRSEKLVDIQDINESLINKIPPIVVSTLNKDLMERFKNLLAEKTAKNSEPAVIVQDFGETILETIASPDGSTNLSRTESPRCDNIFINKNANKIMDRTSEANEGTYIIQPIDGLPNAQSAYRDHEHLWKFYVDLDRFKKGLLHHDYDYVINILKTYAEKQDENPLFVRSCSSILRTEVKRSEYHLANIIRRTGNKYFNTT